MLERMASLAARSTRAWFAGLALLMCAFYAGWVGAPLTVLQINAGAYFGVFCNNWDRFGFWELRGLPLGPQLVEHASQAGPYLHHPPGLSWLFYLLGGEEWSMRLPTVLAGFVASIAFYRVARSRLARAPSFFGACLLAFSPCFAELAQASYEPMVVACGLVVMAEAVRPCHNRMLSRTLQAIAAFAGTWFGWGFAFLGLACLPLVWSLRRPVRSLDRVLVPGVAAFVGLLTVKLWGVWALGAPGITPPESKDTEILQLLQGVALNEHAGLDWVVDHLLLITPTTWSWWLIGTFCGGVWLALWRCPRAMIAMMLAGAGPYVVLVQPADYIWQCYSMPMLAIAGSGALDAALLLRARTARVASALVAVAVLGGVIHSSWSLRADASTPFFRNFGRVLSDAAREPEWSATHSYVYGLPYYYDSPRVTMQGIYVPEQLQPLIEQLGGHGWKYLWLKAGKPGFAHPLMEDFLKQFPRERVPELEGPLSDSGDDPVGGIVEAWVVTLSQPPK